MGYKQIYVLKRGINDPAEVFHDEAFGGIGRSNLESYSFTERYDIIAMDEKTVTVQCKDETV